MNAVAISEGEAIDLRHRLGKVEGAANDAATRITVHEEKCSGRYRNIILLQVVLLLVALPSALPHFATVLSFLGLMR